MKYYKEGLSFTVRGSPMKLNLTQALTAIAANPQAITALSKGDLSGAKEAMIAIGTDMIPGEVDDAIVSAVMKRDRETSWLGLAESCLGAGLALAIPFLDASPLEQGGMISASLALIGKGAATSQQHTKDLKELAVKPQPVAIAPPERISTSANALGVPSLQELEPHAFAAEATQLPERYQKYEAMDGGEAPLPV